MSATSHIGCPHCLRINRLDAARDATRAKCRKCKNPLFDGHPHTVDEAAFDRHGTGSDIPVIVDF
jgi:thioredoxin 2